MTSFAKKAMESKRIEKFSEATQPVNIIDLSPVTEEEVSIKQRKGKEKIIEKKKNRTP